MTVYYCIFSFLFQLQIDKSNSNTNSHKEVKIKVMFKSIETVRQWQVKTDQGHQKLMFECLMCDYATEF